MARVRKEGVTYEVPDKPATPKKPVQKKPAPSGESKKPSDKKADSADKKSK